MTPDIDELERIAEAAGPNGELVLIEYGSKRSAKIVKTIPAPELSALVRELRLLRERAGGGEVVDTWLCETCNLEVIERSFDPKTGEVGIARVQPMPACLNGCGSMRRMTWREAAVKAGERLEFAADELIKERKRVDWLQENCQPGHTADDGIYIGVSLMLPSEDGDLRRAIDNALRSERQS